MNVSRKKKQSTTRIFISNRDSPRVPRITRGGGHSLEATEATEAPRKGAHEAATARASTQQATTPSGLALRAAGSLSLAAAAATADRRYGDEALLARVRVRVRVRVIILTLTLTLASSPRQGRSV